MKNTFLLLSVVLLSSCAREMYQLSDGTYITKRKADRIGMRVLKREFKNLSKEDKESVLMIEIDTSSVN